ncbi:GH39 family glycosyl hydrolase [Limnoglobus roseus]|uniref:GH39-retaining beta-xylosidase n=1 Tax=Limnoglobus roseus TaxID=2598579 RepID=A0A5C1ACY8_9BACT|nr:hypothetical protein [Limnoglobus roseus]QEL16017.1 GH39 - retaining beta-xylosidase [Limnoglobus roseus]
MNRRTFLAALPPLAASTALAADPRAELVFDAENLGEPIRPLAGVNGGPVAAGGILDLSARWKEAAFPFARLHDCHWPIPDVVDVKAVFPDFAADPANPASYDFARTDEFVKAIHDAGTAIVYRLGESIEHQKVKRRVQPPKDFAKWAEVCAGIVRHYTDGWADGFRYPIRYWEIWNEPDNRPNCWTGTDAQFLDLYVTAAKVLKAKFPKLMIGGPGLGNSGDLKGDRLEPTAFLRDFLARCRKDWVPLDFLSWHCYTGDPTEFVRRAKGMRQILDAAGFKGTESHLNEWNYLPDGKWTGMMAKDALARQTWHDRLGGPEGAAFAAAALCLLQDAPLDVANYFSAEAQGMGLFSPHGVPNKVFYAMAAFKNFTGLRRLPLKGELPAGLTALAGMAVDKKSGLILLSRHAGTGGAVRIDLRSAPAVTTVDVVGIDATRNGTPVESRAVVDGSITLDVPAASVRLLRLTTRA